MSEDPPPPAKTLIGRKPWLLVVFFFLCVFVATFFLIKVAVENKPETVPLKQG